MSEVLKDARGVELAVGQTVVYASSGESSRMMTARIAKLGKKVGMIHVDRNYKTSAFVEDDLNTYMQYTTANRVVVVDVLPFVADRMNK